MQPQVVDRADGERGKKKAETGEQDERMVYIGKSSTRYHLQSTCHYLFHNLTQIHSDDLVSIRNQDGKKYKPALPVKAVKMLVRIMSFPMGPVITAGKIAGRLLHMYRKCLAAGGIFRPCSYCAGGR